MPHALRLRVFCVMKLYAAESHAMSLGKLHHNCPAESFRFVYCQQTNIQIKIC